MKSVCDKHLAKARANNTAFGKRRREKFRNKGLCANCGKRPRRFGYETCTICSLRSALANKNRRADKTWARLEALKQKGLITIDEAAEVLSVHRVSVHNFIKKGLLEVKVHTFRRFYVAEKAIRDLQTARTIITQPAEKLLHQRIISNPAPSWNANILQSNKK